MKVQVTETINYIVELPDGTTDPETTAEDAIANADDRDDYFFSCTHRSAQVADD
jgi:hypothetical protein